jgi:hypothetical protein
MIFNFKRLFSYAFFVISGFVVSDGAFCDGLKGAINISPNAAAKWSVICYPPAKKLVYRIKQQKTMPFVIDFTVQKGGVSDTVTNPPYANAWCQYGALAQGDGVYLINISKQAKTGSKKGKVIYSSEIHCESATGVHTKQSKPKRR